MKLKDKDTFFMNKTKSLFYGLDKSTKEKYYWRIKEFLILYESNNNRFYQQII